MDIQGILPGMGIPIVEKSVVVCLDKTFIRLNRSNRGPYSRKKIIEITPESKFPDIWREKVFTEIAKYDNIRQIVITAERLGPKINFLSALGLANGFEIFVAVKNIPQKDYAKGLTLSLSGAVVITFEDLIAFV